MSQRHREPALARMPGRSLTPRRRVLLSSLALAFAGLIHLSFAPPSSAKAPPHATTIVAVEALAAPQPGQAVALIPAGTEVELTGDAAPGFLAIYYDGRIVWVPAQFLTLGVRPGIDTAVVTRETPLLEAPDPGADALGSVPAGETVILIGARVGDYDAGSYDGAGGWLARADLEQ